ncbi:TRAP transporter large permease [Sulfitobacter geojensis]|uniref:TRAP transporter large permease n=1 Tax=Sulfitobacter geojensis TaxID=1342299 RepID=UPI000468723F|nr:TRAP transporter large permease [Sulfitobacter geojensis]KHA54084.1 TRAP dicarboxylate transporter, DctM subunit [Sulfitobacter geojensis]NYI29902.1 tripartite ATP-independent transporter DctM subunit [Sulfitobacter geojensis]
MDPLTIGYLGFAALIMMVMMGVHIAFATGVVGFLGIVALKGWTVAANISGIIPHSTGSNYLFSVLPMFILIGFFAHASGMVQGAYRAARAWIGWMPGGLAISTVLAAGGFGAVSGASQATAAVFARVAIPELLKLKYNPTISAAAVAASGTLASLIPPSAALVVYGAIVDQSIGRLLLAGFVPGIFSALLYAGFILLRFSISPDLGRPIKGITWAERGRSIPGVLPIVLVMVMILGGMSTGWMTPTEAGAVGASIVFVYALMRRSITFKGLNTSLVETANLTVMLFSTFWGVFIFSRFLAFTRLPTEIAEWLVALPYSPTTILVAILLGYAFLGMFLSASGMMLLTLPVIFPAVVELGIDPIVFGILVIKMVEIGLITPPVGLNVYVVASIRTDIPIGGIFKAIWPFVLIDVLTVALLILFPAITTFLPNLVLGESL